MPANRAGKWQGRSARKSELPTVAQYGGKVEPSDGMEGLRGLMNYLLLFRRRLEWEP